MPRYEKIGKTKSHFFEILITGSDTVVTAEGVRSNPNDEWSVDRKSPRKWFATSTAQEMFDEKVAAILAKKYTLVGDKLDVIKPPPPMTPEELETAKRIGEYIALFENGGKVMWTGNKPDNADQFVEVWVEEDSKAGRGWNVLERKGKIGSKVTPDKDNYAHHRHALRSAAIRLNMRVKDGFGA